MRSAQIASAWCRLADNLTAVSSLFDFLSSAEIHSFRQTCFLINSQLLSPRFDGVRRVYKVFCGRYCVFRKSPDQKTCVPILRAQVPPSWKGQLELHLKVNLTKIRRCDVAVYDCTRPPLIVPPLNCHLLLIEPVTWALPPRPLSALLAPDCQLRGISLNSFEDPSERFSYCSILNIYKEEPIEELMKRDAFSAQYYKENASKILKERFCCKEWHTFLWEASRTPTLTRVVWPAFRFEDKREGEEEREGEVKGKGRVDAQVGSTSRETRKEEWRGDWPFVTDLYFLSNAAGYEFLCPAFLNRRNFPRLERVWCLHRQLVISRMALESHLKSIGVAWIKGPYLDNQSDDYSKKAAELLRNPRFLAEEDILFAPELCNRKQALRQNCKAVEETAPYQIQRAILREMQPIQPQKRPRVARGKASESKKAPKFTKEKRKDNKTENGKRKPKAKAEIQRQRESGNIKVKT